MRGKCRRCGCTLPPTHGYCLPCAIWTDGYRSGSEHCDDFEGLTSDEADAYAADIGPEAWEAYAEDLDPTPDPIARGRELYIDGLRAGLRADAAARLARGCLDCGGKLDPINRPGARYCAEHN